MKKPFLIRSLAMSLCVALLASCFGDKSSSTQNGPNIDYLVVKGMDRILVGDCRTYWVQLYSNNGPQTTASTRKINISVGGDGSYMNEDGTAVLKPSSATIYADNKCRLQSNVAEVPANADTVAVYIRTTKVESILLVADDESDSSRPGHLIINTYGPTKTKLEGPAKLIANQCSGAITLTTLDPFDQVFAVPFDTLIQLTGGAGGTFYASSDCTDPIVQAKVPAGETSLTVYYKNSTERQTVAVNAAVLFAGLTGSTIAVDVLKAATIDVPASIPLADAPVNTQSRRTFTVTNTGDVPATNVAWSVGAAPFSVETTCTATLAPAANCQVTAVGTPDSNKSFSSSLALNFNNGVINVPAITRTLTVLGFYPDGALDPTFNNAGKVVAAVGANAKSPAVMQADGKMVMATTVSVGGVLSLQVARFLPTGALDTTFNSTGVVTTTPTDGSNYSVDTLAINPSNNRIYIGGHTSSDLLLARYNPTGQLEKLVINDVGPNGMAKSITFLADTRVLVAGIGDGEMVIGRYSNALTLDNSFGTSGFTSIAIPSTAASAEAAAVLSDGSIIGVGNAASRLVVFKLLSDGTPDSNFAAATQTLPAGVLVYDTNSYLPSAMLIQSVSGVQKVLVATRRSGNTGRFTVYRFTTAGRLDNTFDGNGLVGFDITGNDAANAIALQADGKILVAGRIGSNFGIARLSANGTRETTFNNNTGSVIVNFGVTSEAFGIAVQPGVTNRFSVGGRAGAVFGISRHFITRE